MVQGHYLKYESNDGSGYIRGKMKLIDQEKEKDEFKQDNRHKHATKLTQECFPKKKVKVPALPSQSPSVYFITLF